ncbi:MAG: segregation/condensation protein A [candidate division WOR-3 bacterium]|jgi:segregation and condensation protein A
MVNDILNVRLDQFEGPLDLLLYLIKKNEINIYDIPIQKITLQYLEILDRMKELNIDIASDYIVMAATLIKIKSDMLIPSNPVDGEDIEDPRKPLVERLIEYQKFKKITEILRNIELESSKLFSRNVIYESKEVEEKSPYTLVDLMDVFIPLLKKGESLKLYRDPKVKKTIVEKTKEILQYLNENKEINFFEYVKNFDNLFEIILTFIAILDLALKGFLHIDQKTQFDDIKICLK